VALASLGTVEAGAQPRHAGPRACGRWPRTNLRQVLIALGALMAGQTVEPPAVVPLADPLAHGLGRQDPGREWGLVLYRFLWQGGGHGLLKPLCWPCGARASAPGPLGERLEGSAVHGGVADSWLGPEQVEFGAVRGTSSLGSSRGGGLVGSALGKALNVAGVATALQHPGP